MTIINIIFYFLIIPVAGNYLADWSNLIQTFKYWLFYRIYSKRTKYQDYRLKPLDCPGCLSFWLGVIFLILTYTTVTGLILPFACAGMATVISRIYRRL
jgi:hypothetical protein